MALAAIPFGLGIGISLGTLGGGGSVLAVPVLVYVLGQTVHQATTASLVIVTGGAIVGGLSSARKGRVCWRHAAAFATAALPGVILGTALGQAVSGGLLIAGFAVIMLAAAALTWRKASRDSRKPGAALESPTCPPLLVARDLAAGLIVGAMTGFFGVGGGFLIVPTLAVALALSMRLAVGTSLVIITVTSLMALIAHLAAGRGLDLGITTAMSAACVVGAFLGARFAGRLSHRQLGMGFAALVIAVASYLLVSVAVLGGPPGGS